MRKGYHALIRQQKSGFAKWLGICTFLPTKPSCRKWRPYFPYWSHKSLYNVPAVLLSADLATLWLPPGPPSAKDIPATKNVARLFNTLLNCWKSLFCSRPSYQCYRLRWLDKGLWFYRQGNFFTSNNTWYVKFTTASRKNHTIFYWVTKLALLPLHCPANFAPPREEDKLSASADKHYLVISKNLPPSRKMCDKRLSRHKPSKVNCFRWYRWSCPDMESQGLY